MDYQILESEYNSDLCKEVKDAIEEGWRPLGGCTLTAPTTDTGTYVYVQAMILEK